MDAFDIVQNTQSNSLTSYAKHPDICLVEIEKVEYKKGKYGAAQDAEIFDLTMRLLSTATQNNAKDAQSAGDVIKHKAVLPHPSFSEKSNEVKASIFKRLCESTECMNFATYKENRNALVADLTKKQVKVAIILEEAFVVDKDTQEPLIKNYARVSIIEHVNKTINKTINEISKVVPLRPQQKQKYDAARQYWEQNNPNIAQSNPTPQEDGQSDDPFDMIG